MLLKFFAMWYCFGNELTRSLHRVHILHSGHRHDFAPFWRKRANIISSGGCWAHFLTFDCSLLQAVWCLGITLSVTAKQFFNRLDRLHVLVQLCLNWFNLLFLGVSWGQVVKGREFLMIILMQRLTYWFVENDLLGGCLRTAFVYRLLVLE